jgi:hypothetical protein
VLVVDRPLHYTKKGRVIFEITDRPVLEAPQEPWYVGPEMTFAEQQKVLSTLKGPHPSGIYYSNTGAILGGGG